MIFNDWFCLMNFILNVIQLNKIYFYFKIGVRYYPILVAFRSNQFLINLSASIYMWIDLTEVVFQYGKCNIKNNLLDDGMDEARRELWYSMVYKILFSIPLSIFMSFVVISLTYRTMINLIDFIFRYSSSLTKKELTKSSSDTVCCTLGNIDDEHEMFYSKFDLQYVLDIFENNKTPNQNDKNKSIDNVDVQDLNKNLKYSKVVCIKETKLKKIMNIIYRSDPSFRFTSRYINSLMVTFIALYYFVVYFARIVIIFTTYFTEMLSILDDAGDKVNQLGSFLTSTQSVTYGEICQVFGEFLCVDSLLDLKIPIPQLPKATGAFSKLNATLMHLQQINLASSINAITIVPIVGAYLICLLQLFMFVRETRLHLKQLHKGNCEFVVKAKNLNNGSIASSSFHFGG